MKKLLALSLISVLSFGGLVACSDEPQPQAQVAPVQQPVQQVPIQTQPQVVVVDNGNSNDGLSAGEAMLVGAAAGAIAGNLTSNNNSRDVHHYYNDSGKKYNNSYTSSQPNYNKAYTSQARTTNLPPVSALSNSNKLANKSTTTSVSTSSSSSVKKPISFNLTKPSSSSMTASSSKSFKSSGSGFKSSSRRR